MDCEIGWYMLCIVCSKFLQKKKSFELVEQNLNCFFFFLSLLVFSSVLHIPVLEAPLAKNWVVSLMRLAIILKGWDCCLVRIPCYSFLSFVVQEGMNDKWSRVAERNCMRNVVKEIFFYVACMQIKKKNYLLTPQVFFYVTKARNLEKTWSILSFQNLNGFWHVGIWSLVRLFMSFKMKFKAWYFYICMIFYFILDFNKRFKDFGNILMGMRFMFISFIIGFAELYLKSLDLILIFNS